MNRICVVTSQAGAYYTIVSRLRRAGLPFVSMVSGSDLRECSLVLTTATEAGEYGEQALAVDDLDENPGVFKGQIVSRLAGSDGVMLIGVDPGTRIGMAVFYGETGLAFSTFESTDALRSSVGAFVRRVPAKKFVVRVGNGNPAMAADIVAELKREVSNATFEVVDESGTSVRNVRVKGVKGDQGAAAKIAFRKGEVVGPPSPKTPSRISSGSAG